MESSAQCNSHGRVFVKCNSIHHRDTMKLKGIFNGEKDMQKYIIDMEAEIEKLQAVLVREQALNRVLTSAMKGPLILPLSDSSLISPHVQVVLAELVIVEKEIIMLEKKVAELKMDLYQERKKTVKRELQMQRNLRKHKKLADDPEELIKCIDDEKILRKGKMVKDRLAYSDPLSKIQNVYITRPNDKFHFY